MFIDINVHPDFYADINLDKTKETLRHNRLNIHHNGLASLNHISNQMNCASIDRMVLMANDCSSTDKTVLVSNEEIKKLIDLGEKKFLGFASVDPNSDNYLQQLEFAFSNLKLSGLVLYPARQYFFPNEEKVADIYQLCIAYNKPIMFQCGLNWEPNALSKYVHPLHFEEVAIKYPTLKLCISGFGWPWVRETAMLLLKYPNIYSDTSVLYFDSAREFYSQIFTKDIPYTWIDRSLRHQVMFGSNNPRFEQIRMAKALSNLGYRDSTVELIKGQNALDFLGISNTGEKSVC
ncbi:MAG: amidohydrolase family protein [Sphaerochaetaceae bacterium]|nr:amidohydrolase family protein [Sphaerochaetaceae bacterium]